MPAAGDAAVLDGDKSEQTRWVIAAKATQLLVVQFQSEDMGSFRETLSFEVDTVPLCMPSRLILPHASQTSREYADCLNMHCPVYNAVRPCHETAVPFCEVCLTAGPTGGGE